MADVGHAYLTLLPSLRGISQVVRDGVREGERAAPALGITAELNTTAFYQQVREATRSGGLPALRILAELASQPAEAAFAALIRRMSSREIDLRVALDNSVGTAVRGLSALGDSSNRATAQFTAMTAAVGAATLRGAVMAAALTQAAGALGALGGAAATASGALLVMPAAALAAAAAVTTLRLGLSGFSDALSASSPAEFAEALGKLSPNAAATAVAVRSMRPAFDGLKLDVQDQLFAGLGTSVRALGGQYLPILRTELTGVAAELNTGARQVSGFMQRWETAADVTLILGNARTAIGNLTGAVAPLLSAFTDVAAVGSTFLPQLTSGAIGAAQSFSEFISTARESGQLAGWISAALDVLRQLGALLGNVFSIVTSVFSAASASGGNMLTVLVGITGQVAEFLESAQGITALQQIFGGLATVAAGLGPIVEAIGQALVTSLAPAVAQIGPMLGEALRSLAPAIAPLGQMLAALAPLLAVAAQAFVSMLVPAVAALAPVVQALAPALSEVVGLLGGALGAAITQLAPVIAALAAVLAPLLSQLGGLMVQAIGESAPALAAFGAALVPIVAQVGGALVQALAAVMPVLGALSTLFSTVLLAALNAVMPVLPVLVGAITQLAQVITTALAAATPVLTEVGTLVGQVLAQAIGGLVPIIPPLAEAFLAVVNALLPLLPIVLQIVTELLPPLITLLTSLMPVIVQGAQLFATLVTAITPLVELIVNLVVPALQGLIAVATTVFGSLAAIVGGAMQVVRGVIETVLGLVTGNWDRAWNGLLTILRGIWTAISGVVRSAVDGVISFVVGLGERILNVFGGAGTWLVQAGRDIINGLINGLKAAWNWVVDWLRSKVSGLINQVMQWLGIRSPSTVFAEIGTQVGAGLALGIENTADVPAAAATEMASRVTRQGAVDLPEVRGTRTVSGSTASTVDAELMRAAVTAGVLAALDQARLRVDGAGVARLVNATNTSNARR
ncbi:phage-related protein [Crossiella equi]|uniref:Phage-related protein n=1 Tax=Crossiella equi TaxID=130796 RepID=A0ABS5ARA5_9PSEU|nr:hypothetical protein [Crossiella equi]MBP2479098.1 phage-related protein [Crossiella equi]